MIIGWLGGLHKLDCSIGTYTLIYFSLFSKITFQENLETFSRGHAIFQEKDVMKLTPPHVLRLRFSDNWVAHHSIASAGTRVSDQRKKGCCWGSMVTSSCVWHMEAMLLLPPYEGNLVRVRSSQPSDSLFFLKFLKPKGPLIKKKLIHFS